MNTIQSKCDELVAAIRASILADIGAALGKPKPLVKTTNGHARRDREAARRGQAEG